MGFMIFDWRKPYEWLQKEGIVAVPQSSIQLVYFVLFPLFGGWAKTPFIC